jgi:hypothetical protein
MPARRPAQEQARPGKTVMRVPRLARTLAGVSVAAVCLSLTPIQGMAAATSVDPATYVHSICTTLGGYRSQVASIQASSDLSSATTLTEVRDRLVTFLTQVGAASSSAVSSLQNAGVPKIKNGNKVAALVVNEVAALRNAFAKATRAAQALNLNNVKSFRSATQAIAKRIGAAGTAASHILGDAKKRYNITALKAAESQDPSCQGLNT